MAEAETGKKAGTHIGGRWDYHNKKEGRGVENLTRDGTINWSLQNSAPVEGRVRGERGERKKPEGKRFQLGRGKRTIRYFFEAQQKSHLIGVIPS